MKKILYVLALGALLLSVFSCATTGLVRDSAGSGQGGVWHRVREGQTLWRIAKAYAVSLEEIKQSNDLQDVVHVEAGTWVKIPGAEKVLAVEEAAGAEPGQAVAMDFSWPVRGEVITPYGKMENSFSFGIDIKSSGNREVRASQDGTVVLAGMIRGYGDTIIIEHANSYCTLYARNIRSLVSEGQKVRRDTVIARSEDPSRPVHYELFFDGKPVNPLFYLP